MTPTADVQVDNQLFSDFKAWKEEPMLDRSCCFLERVYREDIYPCLSFSKTEVHTHTLLNTHPVIPPIPSPGLVVAAPTG